MNVFPQHVNLREGDPGVRVLVQSVTPNVRIKRKLVRGSPDTPGPWLDNTRMNDIQKMEQKIKSAKKWDLMFLSISLSSL